MKRKILPLIAALLMIFVLGGAHAETWLDSYAAQVVQETNYERTSRGLNALRVDAELMRAARLRAQEIAQKFSHTRPDGSSWRTVSSVAYGENIARGQKTPDKAIAAWMTSDGHRRNILRESFGSIGVACVKHGNVYHWVQIFGK